MQIQPNDIQQWQILLNDRKSNLMMMSRDQCTQIYPNNRGSQSGQFRAGSDSVLSPIQSRFWDAELMQNWVQL